MPDQTYSKKKIKLLVNIGKIELIIIYILYIYIYIYIYINTLTGHFIRYT